jgi:hypothetical protein
MLNTLLLAPDEGKPFYRTSDSIFMHPVAGENMMNILPGIDLYKWTLSMWICRQSPESDGNTGVLFGCRNASNNYFLLWATATNTLHVEFIEAAQQRWVVDTPDKFTVNPAGTPPNKLKWDHILVIWDSNQARDSDRARLYFNGIYRGASPSSATGQLILPPIGQQSLLGKSGNADHIAIGYDPYTGSLLYGGGIGYLNFIDGLAVLPEEFGAFVPGTTDWKPHEYTGAYGPKGFRLDFAHTGTGAGTVADLMKDSSPNGNNFTAGANITFPKNHRNYGPG